MSNRGYQETVKNEERFSVRNLPKDKETATARIEVLNDRVVSIETQLENKRVDDFPTDDDYFLWRSRATGALSHLRAEIQFLERWLAGEIGTSGGRFVRYDNLMSKLANEVRERAVALAQEIRKELPVIYSENDMPASIKAAKEHRQVISFLRVRVQEAFVSVAADWQSKGLSMKRIQSVKAPIQALLLDIETQNKLINKYLGEMEQSKTRNGRDWVKILGIALQRASVEGFSLTKEERDVIEQIQPYL